MEYSEKEIARFWSRVEKADGESGCWVWTGNTMPPRRKASSNGFTHRPYGRMTLESRNGVRLQQYVHRIGYELAFGEIPKGLTVDHLCRNHRCVNPTHLELVSRSENSSRNRARRGQNCPILSLPYEKALPELLRLAPTFKSLESMRLHFNITAATATKWARMAGIKDTVTRKKIDLSCAIPLVKSGWSFLDVARYIGCHPVTVANHCHRVGVKSPLSPKRAQTGEQI